MIRITKVTDYGIVLLAHVAKELPNEKFNARELAFRTQIPVPMASKILKILAREGLLLSHRGAKGGYSLGRHADTITVADVVRALEGPIALTACAEVSETDCAIEVGCPVKSNWQRINAVVIDALNGIRISEMAPPEACGATEEAVLQIEIPNEEEEPVPAL